MVTPQLLLELQGTSKELLAFFLFSNRLKQPRELKQAFWLGAMIVWQPLDFCLQDDQSMLVPTEVPHKMSAGVPDTVRV